MLRIFKAIAAAALCGGGILMTGCCGPVMLGSCDSGCGEVYIDPWINEPPQSDPCDSCGNYNGQSCGSCRPMFSGLATLWGYRYESGCDSGCDSCGHDFEPACGIEAPCGGCDSCVGPVEPACGIEAPCGGCDSCSGGATGYVQSQPVKRAQPLPGYSVVETDPLESSRVTVPQPRRVSRGHASPRRSGTVRQ